jgi:hypothetical protein
MKEKSISLETYFLSFFIVKVIRRDISTEKDSEMHTKTRENWRLAEEREIYKLWCKISEGVGTEAVQKTEGFSAFTGPGQIVESSDLHKGLRSNHGDLSTEAGVPFTIQRIAITRIHLPIKQVG